MKNNIKVEDLNIEITKVKKEIDDYAQQVARFNKLINNSKQRLAHLNSKKKKLSQINNIWVTDGAIISYLEKVCDFNIQKIKETILPVKLNTEDEYVVDGWYDMGDFEIHVKKGHVVKVDVEYEEDDNNE